MLRPGKKHKNYDLPFRAAEEVGAGGDGEALLLGSARQFQLVAFIKRYVKYSLGDAPAGEDK